MNQMGNSRDVTRTDGEPSAKKSGHLLVAEDRREITVKGVSEVLSFDDTLVRLVTLCGILNLEGEKLRVHVLNLQDGIVGVTGRLNGVLYESERSESPAPRGKERPRRLFR